MQEWWEGGEYYDYSTAYCGEDDDENDDNKNRKKRMDDDNEEFDECQSYTQVYTVEPPILNKGHIC